MMLSSCKYILLKFSCVMELSQYPLDTQTCAMMLSSCKYILLKFSCTMELSRYPLDTQTWQ